MEKLVDTADFARSVVLELAIGVLITEHPQRAAIQQRIRNQVQQALAKAESLSVEQHAELSQATEAALRDIGV
ncbi:TPA: hypothetical protein ACKQDF_004966 [Stenotrophomonas maltophilia]